VQRWDFSSAEARRVAATGVVFGVAVVGGQLSERVAFGWRSVATWLPDLAVGLTLVGAGLWAARRSRGTGLLLVAAGGAWFAANAWPDTRFVHRAVLAHAIVAFGGWRPRTRSDLVAIAVVYVAAIGRPGWGAPGWTIGLATALVAFAVVRQRRSNERRRAEDRAAAIAALVFAAGAIGSTALRWSGLADVAATVPTLWYEAGILGVAGVLSTALATRRRAVADVVVELSGRASSTLRDALAATLGDSSLQLGYWDGAHHYIDGSGAPVVAGRGRAVTFVDDDGARLAVVVHDENVLEDPAVVDAVATATRLWAANTELRAIVDVQLAELTASRRRLLSAADDERRHLDERLQSGAERHLHELQLLIREASTSRPDGGRMARVGHLVDESIEDLREVAAGLHPRDLGLGLEAALGALASTSPMDVQVDAAVCVVDVELATAIYYVCAEALANSTKHGSATHAAIRLGESEGGVTLLIDDDGIGGADVTRGSGLRGLVDRVEALGGRLVLYSDARGTRIEVDVPRDSAPPAELRL